MTSQKKSKKTQDTTYQDEQFNVVSIDRELRSDPLQSTFTPTKRTETDSGIEFPKPIFLPGKHNPDLRDLTHQQIILIEDAFLCNLTEEEALLTANVTKGQFKRHIDRNPDHFLRLQQLKQNNTVLTKRNISKSLQREDKDMTKWYAEARMNSEFSKKVDVNQTSAVSINIVKFDTTKEAIQAKMEETNKNELLTYDN